MKTYRITHTWEQDFTDHYDMQADDMFDLMSKLEEQKNVI